MESVIQFFLEEVIEEKMCRVRRGRSGCESYISHLSKLGDDGS